jgi:hypothetical protein
MKSINENTFESLIKNGSKSGFIKVYKNVFNHLNTNNAYIEATFLLAYIYSVLEYELGLESKRKVRYTSVNALAIMIKSDYLPNYSERQITNCINKLFDANLLKLDKANKKLETIKDLHKKKMGICIQCTEI